MRARRAWVVLTALLALHVADEAAHDFLGFYNPFMMSLRDMLLWTWLPTFEFGEWLGGLCVAVAVLFALSGVQGRWLKWAALPYGLVMFFNGVAHILLSVYTQRMIPGVLSSPLMMAGAGWLLVAAVREIRASK